jgi:hypothetical protein
MLAGDGFSSLHFPLVWISLCIGCTCPERLATWHGKLSWGALPGIILRFDNESKNKKTDEEIMQSACPTFFSV